MARKIAKFLIVTTLLLSWNFYLLIFTIPIFLFGAAMIWATGNNKKSNLRWTLIPPVLWYPLGLVILSVLSLIGFSRAQKLDFIFPKNFRGRVIIVGNMPCGQKKIIKNGREQLIIPENGILLYQNKLAYGYVDHQYYFDTGNSQLQPIPPRKNYMYFETEKNPPPKNIVGAWLGGTGTQTNSQNQIIYESMYITISSKDSIDKYADFIKERAMDKLIDSLVANCKQ